MYLLVTGFGAAAIGLALLVAPHRMTTGPSLVTLYALAPRSVWGWIFIALAALAASAAYRPNEERFVMVMAIEVCAETAWAVGLTVPSFTGAGVSNVLAPIAWLQLAGTALIVILAGRRPVLPPPARGRRRTDSAG
jgi:hypothetical protein